MADLPEPRNSGSVAIHLFSVVDKSLHQAPSLRSYDLGTVHHPHSYRADIHGRRNLRDDRVTFSHTASPEVRQALAHWQQDGSFTTLTSGRYFIWKVLMRSHKRIAFALLGAVVTWRSLPRPTGQCWTDFRRG